jgi:hypothetical protein
MARIWILALLACVGCLETRDETAQRREDEQQKQWNEPCRDTLTLAATTAGSPNGATCTNKLHRMIVETKTVGAEEIGVAVFCKCVRDDEQPEQP